jgi:hypothetical protein
MVSLFIQLLSSFQLVPPKVRPCTHTAHDA